MLGSLRGSRIDEVVRVSICVGMIGLYSEIQDVFSCVGFVRYELGMDERVVRMTGRIGTITCVMYGGGWVGCEGLY